MIHHCSNDDVHDGDGDHGDDHAHGGDRGGGHDDGHDDGRGGDRDDGHGDDHGAHDDDDHDHDDGHDVHDDKIPGVLCSPIRRLPILKSPDGFSSTGIGGRGGFHFSPPPLSRSWDEPLQESIQPIRNSMQIRRLGAGRTVGCG
ncbi:hypothetical protein CEXT_360121 [Caerostris extrusa]|uniref:Uncharacterized protein n=1 Tax=Caerostris extrusa TaxID=172846 RepID=A0AAV4RCI0_CAEEX|nr:hypothetical protein CEXT_360121 [Caerostris extrusa]